MPKKTTIKKSALCKLRRHSKRKPHRKHSSRRYGGSLRKKLNSKKFKRRGGGIIPSGITQIGYSIIGTGQEVVDGWNGEPSAYASVNPSPEVQRTVNGSYYKSTHGIL
jgi:hypothetical protein